MQIKNIFQEPDTKIFLVINQDDENELNWIIEPTQYEIIPDDDNTFIVKAFLIENNNVTDCFICITLPERIAEIVILKDSENNTKIEYLYKLESSVIPQVAAECYGNYELYYAKENEEIGINVLKNGLKIAKNISTVAEDLGYILRDENRIHEAIEAFKISEVNINSSPSTYYELSELYRELGMVHEQLYYLQKYKENGGI